LIEDSWFNNPVYWKGRLISPQHETKFRLYFCGELTDNYMANKQTTQVANGKIRIRLKAYDPQLLEQSADKIVDTAKKTGAKVSGPIPLPTEKEIVTILRSPHKHKDSREQFEMRTHKRVIDILYPTQKTVESLTKIELPAGVNIEIK